MNRTITTCSACPWAYSAEPRGPIVALLEHWQRVHWLAQSHVIDMAEEGAA